VIVQEQREREGEWDLTPDEDAGDGEEEAKEEEEVWDGGGNEDGGKYVGKQREEEGGVFR
jgi:hypothetical protein